MGRASANSLWTLISRGGTLRISHASVFQTTACWGLGSFEVRFRGLLGRCAALAERREEHQCARRVGGDWWPAHSVGLFQLP